MRTYLRKCEIIDTRARMSYFPPSSYSLPDNMSRLVKAFKLSQEVEDNTAITTEGQKDQADEGSPLTEQYCDKVVCFYMNKQSQLCVSYLECQSSI